MIAPDFRRPHPRNQRLQHSANGRVSLFEACYSPGTSPDPIRTFFATRQSNASICSATLFFLVFFRVAATRFFFAGVFFAGLFLALTFFLAIVLRSCCFYGRSATNFFNPIRCTREERVVGFSPSKAAAPSGP